VPFTVEALRAACEADSIGIVVNKDETEAVVAGKWWVEIDEKYPTFKDIGDWIYNVSEYELPEWGLEPVDFNTTFWARPYELYHATPDENVESIQAEGIGAMNKTRGITNRSVGQAVFTSADPEFVKETVEHVYTAIPATATAQAMTETRAFSRQLVAYLAAFLPTSPYYRSNDSRIAAVCDDQYSATLAMLEETADEAFKVYMTRKTQGWFRRWGCSAAAASPGPGTAAPPSGGGAGAATPGRLPAPDASDDEGGATLITPGGPAGGGGDHVPSPTLDLLTMPPDGGPGRGG
jgi:hypothetical protein